MASLPEPTAQCDTCHRVRPADNVREAWDETQNPPRSRLMCKRCRRERTR